MCRVISLGGDWGRGPVYVRSTSDRVEISCTAVKDEVPPTRLVHHSKHHHYSINSSAVASNVIGTSSPSALATFRFITSSYLVGNCTGRSAGFSPRRMRSKYDAALTYMSRRLIP